MIGIPQSAPADRFETPVLQQPDLGDTAAALQRKVCGERIHLTHRTNPFVPSQSFLTNKSSIRAETPLFNTKIRAEGHAPLWHFQLTPSTQIPTFSAFSQLVAPNIPTL